VKKQATKRVKVWWVNTNRGSPNPQLP
jgi:hypothetical protein